MRLELRQWAGTPGPRPTPSSACSRRRSRTRGLARTRASAPLRIFTNSKAFALCFRFADPLALNTLVTPAGAQILEFFRAAAGPVNHQTVSSVALSHSERERKLGLGKVARPAFHHARTGLAATIHPNGGADGVTIGFRSYQPHPNAAVSR